MVRPAEINRSRGCFAITDRGTLKGARRAAHKVCDFLRNVAGFRRRLMAVSEAANGYSRSPGLCIVPGSGPQGFLVHRYFDARLRLASGVQDAVEPPVPVPWFPLGSMTSCAGVLTGGTIRNVGVGSTL